MLRKLCQEYTVISRESLRKLCQKTGGDVCLKRGMDSLKSGDACLKTLLIFKC